MSKRRTATLDRKGPARRGPSPAERPVAVAATTDTAVLKRAADAVVEACAIVAVVSLPLYFSVLTNTGYEPDKAALVRLLAAIAAGAWLIGFLYDERRVQAVRESGLLLLLGLLVFLAFCIATALSIDPRLSLLGSYTRQAGLVTQAAYAVFLLCAATRLRRPHQIQRLVTLLLFGSVPVVVYGFAQQLGLDPIPTSGDVATLQWPVRSTFGQHVFLGSYLVLLIPFTGARVLDSWNRRSEPAARDEGTEAVVGVLVISSTLLVFFGFLGLGYHRPSLFALFPAVLGGFALLGLLLESLPDSPTARRMRLYGYAALLALQIVVLAFSGARGPWLGFFASVPVFGFLLAWRLHRPRLWKSVLAVSIVGGIFLVVLNIPGGPLQPLRTVPSFQRIADITESGGTEGGSVQGRLLIWQGTAKLMTADPSIGTTWGGIGRDVVGYGPESFRLAFEKVFPLELRRVTSEIWWWDRAHDIYLDYLVDAGLLALLAVVATVLLFFYRAFRLIRSSDQALALVLIAMVSGIAGHLIDGFFGLEMAATLVIFWIIIGLVAGLGKPTDEPEGERKPGAQLFGWTGAYWSSIIIMGLLVALLSPTADHPAILAALWMISSIVGVAMVAWILVPRSTDRAEGRAPSNRRPVARPTLWRRRYVAPLVAVATACLLLALEQMRFETAAIADRSGTTAYAVGQTAAGVGFLEQAASANADDPVYRSELGLVYRNLASSASSYSANSGYHPSGGDAETVDPQSALTLSRDQLFQLSAAALDSARSLSPLESDLSSNLGDTYRAWKHYQQAINAYRQAERVGVDNPKYLDGEALIEIDAGQPQTALSRAEEAAGIDYGYWYTRYALALAYHALGQHAQARSHATAALVLVQVYYPPPPASQLNELRKLEHTG